MIMAQGNMYQKYFIISVLEVVMAKNVAMCRMLHAVAILRVGHAPPSFFLISRSSSFG